MVELARRAWTWTLVGLAVGLVLGYDFASPLGQPRFDWTAVCLVTLVGMFLSVIVAVWPYVRAQPTLPCPNCGAPRLADSALCPACGAVR